MNSYTKDNGTRYDVNMGLLNANCEITRQQLWHQDFKTKDGEVEVLKKAAGRFYGGGISQFSWYEIRRAGKLVFETRNLGRVYRYVELYLAKRLDPATYQFLKQRPLAVTPLPLP